ncbi:MAG: Co2+/Mg2+ efflux protein ApaG [Pseudomonadales bacterium]
MGHITVTTQAEFMEAESAPAEERFVFAYTITIANGSEQPARLLNRHWWVSDGSGDVREVRGSGVVGQQPRIEPGNSFQYTSGAVLETPVGAMHGYYEFVSDDGRRFEVPISAFTLAVPNMRH